MDQIHGLSLGDRMLLLKDEDGCGRVTTSLTREFRRPYSRHVSAAAGTCGRHMAITEYYRGWEVVAAVIWTKFDPTLSWAGPGFLGWSCAIFTLV